METQPQMCTALAKLMKGTFVAVALGISQLFFPSFLGSLTLGPNREFLAGDHLEPCITAQDLVHEVGNAVFVTLDLSFFTVVKACEAEALVRVEHNCRRELCRIEKFFICRLQSSVQPHPLHLRTPVTQLRSELFGKTFEHVCLPLGDCAVFQVDDAQSLAFEADVLLRLGSELRHLLNQPRFCLLDRLRCLSTRTLHLEA
mmetsp:Transcript_43856/g.86995  ORF Transcript_43856/g.86995 Transcript_43856/m.86995 type:complete len:201 (+) Transcript_43856:125-727(+)